MRRHPQFSAARALGALCGLLLLLPASALAEGFGTPTMDGLLSAGDVLIYNAAEASDPADSPQGNNFMDLGTLWVANDANFWLQANPPIQLFEPITEK